jgi:hypothetical protein
MLMYIKLSFLFFVLKIFNIHFMGGDPSSIWFNTAIKRKRSLNIQTRTVLSIHDSVNEYCLKLLPEIYELICLGHVGVLS